MKRLALIFASLMIISCGSKGDAPVVEYIEPQIADEPEIMLVAPEQKKPDNDVYVTVIATGFGDTERAALADARREAVIAAAEIALEKGDAYIDDFKKIIDNLPSRNAEFVKDVKKVAGRSQAVEVAAKVNYTKLTDAINALNAVVYRIPANGAPTKQIESDEAKKERLLKEFAGVFADLNDVMTVKIESIDYNQAQAKDGMIPFQVNFVLMADAQKYQQKALRMIDIVTKELGAEYMYTVPVSYVAPTKYELGYYRAPLKNLLNERMYAAVVNRNGKEVVEVYRLSEHYRRFFNDAYAAEQVIGSPKNIQLCLRLGDNNGDVMYEDFVQPFTSRMPSGRQNRSEMEGIYPAVYIVNKHEKTDYNGRFRLGSYHATMYGAIRLEVGEGAFRENIINDQFNGKYPYKLAVTAPYILADIGFSHTNYNTKELRMQYEGLISIADIKKLKSVSIETVK